MTKIVHVAVGVVINEKDQVLIAKRPQHLHQGGLWEFPGGKVEENESLSAALVRELKEEVGIDVVSVEPFTKIHHDYGDKQVLLDVCLVKKFKGVAQSCEGQLIQWVAKKSLREYAFPNANQAIIDALPPL